MPNFDIYIGPGIVLHLLCLPILRRRLPSCLLLCLMSPKCIPSGHVTLRQRVQVYPRELLSRLRSLGPPGSCDKVSVSLSFNKDGRESSKISLPSCPEGIVSFALFSDYVCLKLRIVGMISIGGVIGTGLFLGSAVRIIWNGQFYYRPLRLNVITRCSCCLWVVVGSAEERRACRRTIGVHDHWYCGILSLRPGRGDDRILVSKTRLHIELPLSSHAFHKAQCRWRCWTC